MGIMMVDLKPKHYLIKNAKMTNRNAKNIKTIESIDYCVIKCYNHIKITILFSNNTQTVYMFPVKPKCYCCARQTLKEAILFFKTDEMVTYIT